MVGNSVAWVVNHCDTISAAQSFGAQSFGAQSFGAHSFGAANAAGAVLGGLLGVPILLGAIAWLRDPVRRRSGQPRLARAAGWAAPHSTVDVTTSARRLKRRAQIEFYGQALGISMLLDGLLPLATAARALCLIIGGILSVAIPVVRHNRASGPVPDRFWAFAGPRPTRAIALLTIANVLAVIGGLGVVYGAIVAAKQPDNTTPSGIAFLCLAGAALCVRRARRLSAVTARQLLARDTRPMVLYLRAFGDDERRLRSASLGRRGFLERLSPNRFDAFEEVLVRHLTPVGPVIAINPPGTRLAPLGAARDTLPNETWQGHVDHWLRSAGLVVITAPPVAVTPGLLWELAQIAAVRQWQQTLVVVPPLPDDEVRRRWYGFAALDPSSPFAVPLPVDPAAALVLTLDGGQWRATVSDERDEWSYAASLSAALRYPAANRLPQ